ncbi:hypothetical protein [Frigoribacterium faeni]|uniref:Di-and tripeptidase n=1 Tax=Frigoribacterium faeni TaxID=145483 RepID=A0A7W3JIE9_9MICO|nr:hypothetical protein [Frigoribacterium faeni]MBA8813440.1 hypothetical protein [Frigoribacterium faeni]GEK83042.1 hypothetical protein FFA01_13510 [Frigoribacterium faeni]
MPQQYDSSSPVGPVPRDDDHDISPVASGSHEVFAESPWLRRLDRLLSVQRPVVVRHVRALRRRHKKATPEKLIRILEREYLTAVTTGGAAVGASAVVPGVGWGISLALSGVETAGFLEASALFAQSVTEVHGISVTEPDRARALVMAMMLGAPGATLVRQFAGEALGTAPARSAFWGELVTQKLPKAAIGGLTDSVRRSFVRRFATSQTATIIGRAVPFGIGAVVGGTGNHLLGRKVVTSARTAFGPPPAVFVAELNG